MAWSTLPELGFRGGQTESHNAKFSSDDLTSRTHSGHILTQHVDVDYGCMGIKSFMQESLTPILSSSGVCTWWGGGWGRRTTNKGHKVQNISWVPF